MVAFDHFLDRRPDTVCPPDATGLVKRHFPLPNPGLGFGGLFTGEGLPLLVDLHPITKQAYLCRITDAAVGALACSNSGHDRLVQLLFGLVICTNKLQNTPFYPLKHALNT